MKKHGMSKDDWIYLSIGFSLGIILEFGYLEISRIILDNQ